MKIIFGALVALLLSSALLLTLLQRYRIRGIQHNSIQKLLN